MFNVSIFDIRKVLLIYKEMATSVTLPGEDGELAILDFHEFIISCLKQGTIKVNDRPIVGIKRGIAKVQGNELFVLVER